MYGLAVVNYADETASNTQKAYTPSDIAVTHKPEDASGSTIIVEWNS